MKTPGIMSVKEGTDPSTQRRTNSRMRERLQASLAGLEELRMLRDHQQSLVEEAKGMMDRNKTRRHSFESQNSLLEYIRPEAGHNSRSKRNSLSVVPEHDADWQEIASRDIVNNWLQTTSGAPAQSKKQIGSSSDSDSKSIKDNSASNTPQNSPRNCDTDSQSNLKNEIPQDHVIKSESPKSEDVVDGKEVSEHCEKSETAGAKSGNEVVLRQSVSELSGYSRCSPHRRFSFDVSLLSEMERKPFLSPYGRSLQKEKTGASDNTNTAETARAEQPGRNATGVEKGQDSNQIAKKAVPKSFFIDEPDGTDVMLRANRRQSCDLTSASAGLPQKTNLSRRASFAGVSASTPRTTYQKSYTLSGCKTKFNFPSPLHAVLMNRQKVVVSEDNDCVASSSGSDSTDTLTRSSETSYDTDSQVHDHLYNILSQDDSPAKQSSPSSLRGGKAASKNEIQGQNVSKCETETVVVPEQRQAAAPSPAPARGTDLTKETFDSESMKNIRAACNNTRRASVGEVFRREPVPTTDSGTETVPPPLQPRKSRTPIPDRGVPSRVERTNHSHVARSVDAQSKAMAQVSSVPRSRGSVDTELKTLGRGGNIPRSRGSIDVVMGDISSLDSPRLDAEPSAHSTPRSGTPNFVPRGHEHSLPMSSFAPALAADKVKQDVPSSRDSNNNNNGTADNSNELRTSDDSLRFSRCGSPDSLFDRPPPIPEKRFSLRSDTADSGFAGSCMSLLTTSSGYSYKARNSYDPKLSIASIEEGYLSSQSTDSPKQKHHHHKLSIQSDCSFMSTGSSYFGEDEMSDEEHHDVQDTGNSPPEHFPRNDTAKGRQPQSVEINCISVPSEAKKFDAKGANQTKPTLRRGSLASSTVADFRQILHENKKNQNKSLDVQSSGRRYSLPTNYLNPQSALRQKYLRYNNIDLANVQDTSI